MRASLATPMSAPSPAVQVPLMDAPAGASLHVIRPGSIDYACALAWQREAAAAVRTGERPETLFLLTHPPVITMGRRATGEHVLFTKDELAARGVELVKTDRGGDVTFHGPGQIVGYPILDLRRRGLGAHTYLRFLERTLIAVLNSYGIEAFTDPACTGVWTPQGKIVAMGIRVSGGVSLHGFALNVRTDLRYFGMIVPCGIQGRAVATMEQCLGRPFSDADTNDVMDRLEAAFRAAPSCQTQTPQPVPETHQ